ncbi:MAG: flagellin [Vampirovibrionales bacterium]|nr:flagellin [Vampirovibrionales bacterium]
MPLVINTNTMAMNAQRNLSVNNTALSKSLEKLSSGFRINRGADDAAGLQVSENLRSQVRGSKKALDNVQDGINVLNIADGALGVITDNLQRMRELAVQGANSTYDANQRTAINAELTSRANDITRIANATKFNGVFLLNGSANGAGNFTLQVGANNVAANDTIDVGSSGSFAASRATDLSVNAVNVTNIANAVAAITSIDAAIVTVSQRRGTIGSVVNQLESASQNLEVGIENLAASESRIRNVDVASESSDMVRNQILQQSAAAILSQANQAPSLALQLIK